MLVSIFSIFQVSKCVRVELKVNVSHICQITTVVKHRDFRGVKVLNFLKLNGQVLVVKKISKYCCSIISQWKYIKMMNVMFWSWQKVINFKFSLKNGNLRHHYYEWKYKFSQTERKERNEGRCMRNLWDDNQICFSLVFH